jgi:phospholipid/cholesterol/gamma-HCH transport system permease protein
MTANDATDEITLEQTGATDGVVSVVSRFFEGFGDWTQFSLRACRGIISRKFPIGECLNNCISVGIGSLTVVGVTGTFIGMVLAVQAYGQFHQIGLETSLGAVIHMSVVRELGPVLTAIMLAGRVGGAMAAELGTMKVTEQIDAMSCLGVDPVKYLVSPRIVAAIVMIPLLTIFADIMGLFGSSLICLKVFHIDSFHYWRHTRDFVSMFDVFVGLFKSIAFGGVVAAISCHRGFQTQSGAEGVGRSATQSFVYSFVAILAIDFVLGLAFNGLHDAIWPGIGGKAIGGES